MSTPSEPPQSSPPVQAAVETSNSTSDVITPEIRQAAFRYAQLKARCTAAFVWAVYLLSLLLVGRFVYTNAVNVPFGDEWDLLPWTARRLPLSWQWFWMQHNEHRIALSRLILLVAHAVSGHDFRSGGWVVLGMQAVLAAILLATMRFVRGRFQWTDIVVPLALLNVGHAENLLWSFQVQFAGSALVPGILLVLVIRHARGPQQWWEVLAVAVCSVALCGFGASSIVYAPFFVLWQLYLAWQDWRSHDPLDRRRTLAFLISACVTTSVMGYYFWNLQRMTHHPPPPSLWAAIETALQFCAVGIVADPQPYWPIVGGIIPLVLLAVGVCLLKVFQSKPAERNRVFGLMMFLAAFLTLAAGIGWGRSGLGGNAGFSLRYVTLSVASVVLTYGVVVLYAPPRARSWLQALICVGTLMTVWLSFGAAEKWESTRVAYLRSFEKDLKSGMRTAALTDLYTSDANSYHLKTYPSAPALANHILMAREMKVGPFQPSPRDGHSGLATLQKFDATPLNGDWDATNRALTVQQSGGGVKIELPTAEFVQRISLALHVDRAGSNPLPCRILGLRRTGPPLLLRDESLKAENSYTELWIPVDQEITAIQLNFASPAQLRIVRLVLLQGRPDQM